MGVSFVQDTLPDAIEEEKDEYDPLLGQESFPLGVARCGAEHRKT